MRRNTHWGRIVSALLLSAAFLTVNLQAAPSDKSAAHANKSKVSNLSVVPTITQLRLSDGQLLASGVAWVVVKGKTYADSFTDVPVTLSVVSNAVAAPVTCPVLNLQLGPIHLDLLGLVVDTSPICLDITAIQGGGLLGDLLCGVANLLNNGSPIGTVLGGLTATQLNDLLFGLTSVLNEALASLSQAILSSISPGADPGTCAILNLTLGPVNLTLLGLNVVLDNCAAGPLTVTITGEHGGLLGNLLCGLAGGSQLPLNTSLSSVLGQLLGSL